MPKIRLKHRSPEFAETSREEARPRHRACDVQGCPQRGEFRAPRDRTLKTYYNFCLDHVQEYNKSWNFFDGMSPDQMQEHMMRSLYGDRPTWRYDLESRIGDILRRKIHDVRTGTEDEAPKSHRPRRPVGPVSPEYQAMMTLGLEPPFTLADVKARYKALVRLHHPDRNGGSRESEDQLKAVNTAYAVLIAAIGLSGEQQSDRAP